MLGRLLSLRPDLAQDRQGDDQAPYPQAPALAPSLGQTSAPLPNTGDNTQPLQFAQAHHGVLQIDPFVTGPRPPVPMAGDQEPPIGPLIVGEGLLGLGLGALIHSNAKKTEEPGNEEETVGQSASRAPTGSLPIDQTPWSGDHTEIKGAIESKGPDHVRISPKGYVWGQNPDGSWTNHGPAGSFTASGKPSGQRGKDRGRWK